MRYANFHLSQFLSIPRSHLSPPLLCSFADRLIVFPSYFCSFATPGGFATTRVACPLLELASGSEGLLAMAMEFLPSVFVSPALSGCRNGLKEEEEGEEDGENEVLFAEFLESEVLGQDADDPALPEVYFLHGLLVPCFSVSI